MLALYGLGKRVVVLGVEERKKVMNESHLGYMDLMEVDGNT